MQVQVSEDNTPKSIKLFDSFGLFDILLKNLFTHNVFKPTQFQRLVIPNIMASKDLFAIIQTGSEKNVAYVLPILHKLLCEPKELSFDEKHIKPQVIILAPSKEIMKQIYNTLDKFGKNTHIKCAFISNGASIKFQKFEIALQNGIHILVATPGRLKSFVDKGFVILSSVRIFVLDETNEMSDINSQYFIEYILNHSTLTSQVKRQTLMFSATHGNEIKYLAKSYLKSDKINVDIGVIENTCKYVEIKKVYKFEKKKALISLLKEMDGQKTIVFVQEKRIVDCIAIYLCENDFPATSIHGDREIAERKEALIHFKANKVKILVLTSVACKELDIKDIQIVVNYDLPHTVDEYVHRIECTGSLGNIAKAISFFDPECDSSKAFKLIGILKQVEQEIPPWLIKAAHDFSDFKKALREARKLKLIKFKESLN